MMKTDAGTCASLSVSLLTTSSRLSNHFLLYTPIIYMYVYVYYVHSISCMCVWLADSDICVHVYDIIDDTSAMWDNWPIGNLHTKTAFRLCFTRLILTLKQVPRMHQNAPLPDKKSKYFLSRGHGPLLRPHSPQHLRRLDSRAFGARRSLSFSFTTQTVTITRNYKLTVEQIGFWGRLTEQFVSELQQC